jgi:hypothetical protein
LPDKTSRTMVPSRSSVASSSIDLPSTPWISKQVMLTGPLPVTMRSARRLVARRAICCSTGTTSFKSSSEREKSRSEVWRAVPSPSTDSTTEMPSPSSIFSISAMSASATSGVCWPLYDSEKRPP